MGKLDVFTKPLQSSTPNETIHPALKDKTVQCIGLIQSKEHGKPVLQNVVLTIKNGKIVDVELMDPAVDESTVINDATGWIDTHYWREWK